MATKITTDPRRLPSASEIPPSGSELQGSSAQGIVEVYSGTLAGDVDAQPAAKELLMAAPDTEGLTNAEYVYNRLSALYGGVQCQASKPLPERT
jgi:hypothetical protein